MQESIDGLDKLLDDFLRFIGIELNYSENTVNSYSADLQVYFAWLRENNIDFKTVDQKRMRSFLMHLENAAYQRTSINRRLSAIKHFYSWLVIARVID